MEFIVGPMFPDSAYRIRPLDRAVPLSRTFPIRGWAVVFLPAQGVLDFERIRSPLVLKRCDCCNAHMIFHFNCVPSFCLRRSVSTPRSRARCNLSYRWDTTPSGWASHPHTSDPIAVDCCWDASFVIYRAVPSGPSYPAPHIMGVLSHLAWEDVSTRSSVKEQIGGRARRSPCRTCPEPIGLRTNPRGPRGSPTALYLPPARLI